MKRMVINYRNSFSHTSVVMFEWPDCSLVMWLQNADAVSGKTHLLHPLDNKMCRHILWVAFGHF